MPVNNTDQFIQLLKQSGIASPEVIALWLERIDDHSQPKMIAKSMVKEGFLTTWQAKFLLSGRHQVKFDNYLLLQRLKKNAIGEQFLAKHLKLNRQVKILFLAKELSAKLQERQDLLRLAATATDINHHGIEHLHTIELQSERFLIVTDFHDAGTLNEPEIRSSLTAVDLTSILSQLTAAIATAHNHGLSHGTLTVSDILFSAETEQLQIQNMVASYLVHNLGDNYTGPVSHSKQDTAAIAKIGERLLRQFRDSCEHSVEIGEALTNLSAGKTSLSEFSDELNRLGKNPTISAAKTHQPNNTPANKLAEQQPQPTPPSPEAELESENRRAALMKWGLIAASAAMILVIGTSLYALSWLFGGDSADYQAAADSAIEEFDDELPSLQSVINDGEQKPDQLEQPTAETLPELSTAAQETDQNSETPTSPIEPKDGSPSELAAAPGSDSSLTEQSPTADSPPDPAPSKTNSILNSFRSITKDKEAPLDPGDSKNSVPAAKKDTNKQPKKPKPKVQPDAAEVANANVSNHKPESTQIPSSVNLPATNITSPTNLLPVDNLSLTIDLICDANISKLDLQFSLVEGDNTDWTIKLTAGKNDRSENVAELNLHDNHLQFSWLEAAAKSVSCGYLANCVLKTKLAGETHYTQLRKPVSLAGLTLSRAEPRIRLDLNDLAFLPRTAYAELLPIDETKFGQTYLDEGREDRRFSRKTPLNLNFRDLPEYQMLFFTLAAEIKGRSRIEAKLQMRLDPSEKPRLANQKGTEQAETFLANQIAELKSRINYLSKPINEIRAEQKLSRQEFTHGVRNSQKKDLQKLLGLAEERSKTFRDLQTQIEPFLAQALPVSIYFEIGGQRVVLATSVFE